MTDVTVDIFTSNDGDVPFATFTEKDSGFDPAAGDTVLVGDSVGSYEPVEVVVLGATEYAGRNARTVKVTLTDSDRDLENYATVSNWVRHRQVPAVDPEEPSGSA